MPNWLCLHWPLCTEACAKDTAGRGHAPASESLMLPYTPQTVMQQTS